MIINTEVELNLVFSNATIQRPSLFLRTNRRISAVEMIFRRLNRLKCLAYFFVWGNMWVFKRGAKMIRSYQRMAAIALSLFLGLGNTVNAAEDDSTQLETIEQIQVPLCLANQLSDQYKTLAENASFKILEVPSKALNDIVHLADKVHCGRFVNVTGEMLQGKRAFALRQLTATHLLSEAASEPTPVEEPYTIKHSAEVRSALGLIQQRNITDTLTRLTNMYDRSATKQTGVRAANKILDMFTVMASKSNRLNVDTWLVDNDFPYIQPSVVTVIGSDVDAPAVVIGAHMDTLDGGRMPGAGDDGSGSAVIMEMARVLLESDVLLKHPVYIIWYSAEERGLIGSKRVVDDFEEKGIRVKAAIQFDMAGFRRQKNNPTMWVYNDYTDIALTDFVEKLINVYIGVPVGRSQCGYGCSDHFSWYKKGIPAAFPCETSFDEHNRDIHTSRDTMDKLTPEHMVNFAKLAVAFAIELAS